MTLVIVAQHDSDVGYRKTCVEEVMNRQFHAEIEEILEYRGAKLLLDLCLVEAVGEAELHASGVFPLLLLESHVAVGAIGLVALGVEDIVHVQT